MRRLRSSGAGLCRRPLGVALVAALTAASVSCGGGAKTEVVISAASSLSGAFSAIQIEFEEMNPGVDVVLNTGGSSILREQILGGAPVDAFAPADQANMDLVAQAELLLAPSVVFAENVLAIAVPSGNPGQVSGLADFADDELVLGMCFESVPCGRLAAEAFELAGVEPSIDTFEANVRALLVKVAVGELDAGVVYATDVLAAGGEVDGVSIPDDQNVSTDYPIAPVAGGSSPELAQRFIDFVLSDVGQSILAEHGFISP